MRSKPLKIGIVAGEASGDLLGSSLMAAIKRLNPSVEFHGIGGTTMLDEGIHPLADLEQLSVNGLVDPLLRLPSLYALFRRLSRELSGMDVVVGVDFNVFNLILERSVHKRGVPTAHYVSPSVYAWRRGRVKKIGRAVDVVMTLFPFETDVYREQGIRAEFVGHPTADRFVPETNKNALRASAREDIGLDGKDVVLCVMPGSRRSELKFHFELFLQAAERFKTLIANDSVKVLIPSGHRSTMDAWLTLKNQFPNLDVSVLDRKATDLLKASDIALVKSGTSTLEAMLVKTPMVVAYRLGSVTFRIIRSMLYIDHVALPNILAKRQLVPEFLQDDATPDTLAEALASQLQSDNANLQLSFRELHRELKQNASKKAAETVLSIVQP